MRKSGIFTFVIALFLSLGLTSCEVVGDIFKAGMWTAVIGVVLVIALVLWLLGRLRK